MFSLACDAPGLPVTNTCLLTSLYIAFQAIDQANLLAEAMMKIGTPKAIGDGGNFQLDLSSADCLLDTGAMLNAVTASNIEHAVDRFILSRASPEAKLDAAVQVMETGVQAMEKGDQLREQSIEVVMRAWYRINTDELWTARYNTLAAAMTAIDSTTLKDIRSAAMRTASRKSKAITRITNTWSEIVAEQCNLMDLGETHLELIARVAESQGADGYEICMMAAHSIAIDRLMEGKRGRGSAQVITATDWRKLKDLSKDDRVECARKHSALEVTKWQWADDVNALEKLALTPQEDTTLKRKVVPVEQRKDDTTDLRRSKRLHTAAVADHATPNNVASYGNENTSDSARTNSVRVSDAALVASRASGMRELGRDNAASFGDYKDSESDSDSSSDLSSVGTQDTPGTDQHRTGSPEDSGNSETEQRTCTCQDVGLDNDFLKSLSKYGPIKSREGRVNALERFGRASPAFRGFCRRHLGQMCGRLGLIYNKLNGKECAARLRHVWKNKDKLDELTTDEGTIAWWRLDSRPATKNDHLQVFAYEPYRHTILETIDEERAKRILQSIIDNSDMDDLKEGAWDAWKNDGNLIFSNFFSWIWDGILDDSGELTPGIGDIVDEEFAMYLHHQCQKNGRANVGWLRTMFYSLTQQLICQDLAYYMAYVALRPDRNHRLISYPYYTKYARSGDSTFFRHLDLNVEKYVNEQKGALIIQGSVSMDNETEESCTELIPGFHHHIEEWWSNVAPENKVNGHLTGLSRRWNNKDNPREDPEYYGVYKKMPCNRGDVRITLPTIPHGSTATANNVERRRAILPWYVSVDEHNIHLDNANSDSWRDLVIHHTTLTAPRITPSGYPNKYGCLPFKFPGTTQLRLSSAVSAAIMCRTSWDDASVQTEVQILLGSDRELAWDCVRRSRIEGLQKVRLVWENVKKVERLCYEDQSAFASLTLVEMAQHGLEL